MGNEDWFPILIYWISFIAWTLWNNVHRKWKCSLIRTYCNQKAILFCVYEAGLFDQKKIHFDVWVPSLWSQIDYTSKVFKLDMPVIQIIFLNVKRNGNIKLNHGNSNKSKKLLSRHHRGWSVVGITTLYYKSLSFFLFLDGEIGQEPPSNLPFSGKVAPSAPVHLYPKTSKYLCSISINFTTSPRRIHSDILVMNYVLPF